MQWFKQKIQSGIVVTVSILSVLCCTIASAEEPRKIDQNDCPTSGLCLKKAAQKLVERLFAYPKKFGLATLEQLGSAEPPPIYTNALGQTMNIGPSQWDMENIYFKDNPALRAPFYHLKDLSLLTLWEDRSYKLYLSLSSDGVAGINFGQKEKRYVGAKTDKYNPLDQPPEIHNPYHVMSAF